MSSMEEIINYIQLINTDNIGPKTFHQLLKKHGSISNVIQNLPVKYKLFDYSKAKAEYELAKHLNITILISSSPEYPQALLNIPDYPPVLYAKGNIELLNSSPSLAIVGSRNASINGRKLASKIAYDLTNQQVTIVSGMARGIDASAHKGALYALNQQGGTIAVLGTGVDIPYPIENKDIYSQICTQGCIISEFPIGTKPQANNFPRRNRIISGLSNGILVVEANLHSGSLITAYTAVEQGREVMAIPGSPLEGRSQGANKLIKDGAYLVENANDIAEILCSTNINKPAPRQISIQKDLFTTPLDNELKTDNIPQHETSAVIDFLTYDGVYVDEIIQISGLDSSVVNSELLYLEMEGKITRHPGNKVALVK